MRIVIAGAGEVGIFLAGLLSKERKDIVVIDTNEDRLHSINEKYDVLTVLGSATSIKILEEAQVKGSYIFIAATHYEHVNIVAASLAKKIGARRTIARVDNLEYIVSKNKRYFKSLGIDTLINPDKLVVDEIVMMIRQSASNEVFEFSKGDLTLFATRLNEKSQVIGKNLTESLKLYNEFEYRAILIVRDEKTFIPRHHDIFQINDIVYAVSSRKGLDSLMKISGQEKVKIDDVMIFGGSKIGELTAKKLEQHFNVKLVEKDKNRCMELSEILDKTLIINADARDTLTLKQENIAKMDVFISVTESSETNIFASILAQRQKVPKTITEVENIDFIEISKDLNIEGIINKKLIAASLTTRYLIDADILSIKMLNTANADIIEVIARQGSIITKKPLAELDLPKSFIIGGVIRNNTSFIARGSTFIRPGDICVVLVLSDFIYTIEEFF